MTQTQKKVKIKAQKLQFQFEMKVLFDFDILCLQPDDELASLRGALRVRQEILLRQLDLEIKKTIRQENEFKPHWIDEEL